MSPKRKISSQLVKSITVHTGVEIYNELSEIRPELYQNAPSEGLYLSVNYVDTLIETDQQFDKVILAVHGTPGYYTNFDKLIEHFRGTKVRVIVPNLPDFSHTRTTRTFWHSTVEKAQFVKDFLLQLNITKIDCLISHSFGIQTIAALWEEPSLKICSVALFSPQPLWDKNKDEVRKILRMFYFKSELWYNFLSLTRIHKLPSMPIRFDNINEFLLACTTVIDDQSPVDLHRRIEHLVNLNIPVILMYGSQESLISKSSIEKLNQKLGIEPSDIIYLDAKTYQVSQLQTNQRINSYVIEGGGHYAHANYYLIANQMVDNLLHKINQ